MEELFLLTQDQLRLYDFCSEKYFLSSGQYNFFSNTIKVVEEAFENIFLQNIEDFKDIKLPIDEIFFNSLFNFNKNNKMDAEEYKNISIKGLELLHNLLKKLEFYYYIPIKSSLEENIKIKKTAIRTKISGVGITKNKNIRGWVFSPYTTTHQIEWDIVHKLQYENLLLYNRERNVNLNIPILYIIYFVGKDPRIYKFTSCLSEQDKMKLSFLEAKIIKGFHYGLQNCLHNCEYKLECKGVCNLN